ncbi:Hypothetical protein CINCED_3A022879 [Cinara cedri]|uniref:Kinetochore protein SPC25 n=2 Tax=Cinara cedri TaxID=506608 RepID=A0A5E4MJT5_9HEMI|nr:Hypothetical protein CINCED_3A022879 [Cinara cedri]
MEKYIVYKKKFKVCDYDDDTIKIDFEESKIKDNGNVKKETIEEKNKKKHIGGKEADGTKRANRRNITKKGQFSKKLFIEYRYKELYLSFPIHVMASVLDLNIDNIIDEYELSYKNFNDNFVEEITQHINEQLKEYEEKIKEHVNILKQTTDINNKVSENREQLKTLNEKIESTRQLLQTERDRLETEAGHCKDLEVEVNKLQDMVNKNQMELTQVSKESKKSMQKLKKEIDLFKNGVKKFEQYLQLSMNIENNNEQFAVVTVSMKNTKNRSNYNIVIEDNNNDYKIIDIAPRDEKASKATELYYQTKDIQGMLAFLYMTKE